METLYKFSTARSQGTQPEVSLGSRLRRKFMAPQPDPSTTIRVLGWPLGSVSGALCSHTRQLTRHRLQSQCVVLTLGHGAETPPSLRRPPPLPGQTNVSLYISWGGQLAAYQGESAAT